MLTTSLANPALAQRLRGQVEQCSVFVSHVRLRQGTMFALVFLSGIAVGAVLVAVTRGASSNASASPPLKLIVEPSAAAQPTLTRASAMPATDVIAPVVPPAPHQVSARTESRPLPIPAPQRNGFRGSVAIDSQPQGADVFINDRRVGTTPIVLQDLPIGSRALRLTLDGHETWSRAVQIVANERATVVARLQRSSR